VKKPFDVLRWRAASEVSRLFGGTACMCLVGCFLSPIPDTRTPADHAREIAPRCAAFSEDASQHALTLVEAVEPAYSFISSGPMDRQARLRGARVHVRPELAMSRESLQRTLECHQARVVLGAARALPDDPYVLPGAWLDLDASSEGDGFVVAVQADALVDARRVLERARRFAAVRR
jgi:hypothetical protein